ncbi:VTT domain-containing protein [Jongsikchunia kroppenstedtii]|uniref:VTT domain-containing protein n=1 Tax=Jongsikchunia kroppenstedtii TaxID=1121721 RepID=UPI000381B3A4|nr:VTT domain-containing protein [Jongsikchunia kroppenstedtii]
MIDTALASATHAATTQAGLLPGFMDPIKLLGYFGTWALVGLLVCIFVESGVIWPILPGDSLLFVAGMVVAGTAHNDDIKNFASLWELMIYIPIVAIAGGQVGYWIGKYAGTSMFSDDSRFLKKRYLDEAHEFFEKRGPITIFLARFVPIVRTLAPLVAGAAGMKYRVFVIYNVVGALVWSWLLVLLGYWLGRIDIVQKLIEPIFILIVLVSVLPMVWEWWKRRRAAQAPSPAE